MAAGPQQRAAPVSNLTLRCPRWFRRNGPAAPHGKVVVPFQDLETATWSWLDGSLGGTERDWWDSKGICAFRVGPSRGTEGARLNVDPRSVSIVPASSAPTFVSPRDAKPKEQRPVSTMATHSNNECTVNPLGSRNIRDSWL